MNCILCGWLILCGWPVFDAWLLFCSFSFNLFRKSLPFQFTFLQNGIFRELFSLHSPASLSLCLSLSLYFHSYFLSLGRKYTLSLLDFHWELMTLNFTVCLSFGREGFCDPSPLCHQNPQIPANYIQRETLLWKYFQRKAALRGKVDSV